VPAVAIQFAGVMCLWPDPWHAGVSTLHEHPEPALAYALTYSIFLDRMSTSQRTSRCTSGAAQRLLSVCGTSESHDSIKCGALLSMIVSSYLPQSLS
jgi:hypothetical protein